MATLAELRAKLQKADEKSQGKGKSRGDGLTFPFWDAKTGDTSTLRFLPDGNQDNTYFWKERQVIKLEFPGIKGHDENKVITIQVPCMEMWGETCPILQEIRPWFKGDKEQEALARKYWKKRTYMFQGFVRDSAISEDEAPENPIRKFIIGPQIFGPIKNALLDPDMENIPTDYLLGTDFRLTKGNNGQYADYGNSVWARKETALTEIEAEAVEKYGLVDLETYLPAKPSPEALAAIFDMFEASVEGELYDPEQFAEFYKPYGFEYTTSARKATGSAPAAQDSTPAAQDSTPAAQESTPAAQDTTPVSTPSSGQSAQDILAKIRGNS